MTRADVIVVGGGPAGSTAATMLARKGWSVLLFEKERFPRDHIGESLLPASLPILEELGALDAVRAEGFLDKYGATMVWGAGRETWSWYFRETNRTHPSAFQVWRPRFDQILLENAARHGVDVREGHRVLEVEPLSPLTEAPAGRDIRVRYAGPDGVANEATAGFVVDASGQEGLIGRRLGLREADEHFRNLAVYAYFEGCQRLPSPDETNILIESFENGWLWLIPLQSGWMSVGAVVDHQFGSEGIRSAGAEAFLRAQIAAAPNAARMLRDATLVKGPNVLRDWSYSSRDVVGARWVLAGDAACFIDPLFSTGVHLALSAGVLAAAYVTTALKDPGMAVPAAAVYKDLYYSQYHLFRQLAGLFYSTNRSIDSYFWEARRIIGDESLAPRSAFIRAVAGQPPKGYERAVLERGEAPEGLVSGLRALVSDRAERRERFDAALAKPGPGVTALHSAVPVLAAAVSIDHRPVLADGEFEWGEVLVSEGRPEGTAVSGFVARLVELADGRRNVAAIAAAMAELAGASPAAVTGNVLSAIGVLYAEGAIERLAGIDD